MVNGTDWDTGANIARGAVYELGAVYNPVNSTFLIGPSNTKDVAGFYSEIDEYNARVTRMGHKNVPFITPASVKRTAKNMQKPDRRERIRVGDVTRETAKNFSGLSPSDMLR